MCAMFLFPCRHKYFAGVQGQRVSWYELWKLNVWRGLLQVQPPSPFPLPSASPFPPQNSSLFQGLILPSLCFSVVC